MGWPCGAGGEQDPLDRQPTAGLAQPGARLADHVAAHAYMSKHVAARRGDARRGDARVGNRGRGTIRGRRGGIDRVPGRGRWDAVIRFWQHHALHLLKDLVAPAIAQLTAGRTVAGGRSDLPVGMIPGPCISPPRRMGALAVRNEGSALDSDGPHP